MEVPQAELCSSSLEPLIAPLVWDALGVNFLLTNGETGIVRSITYCPRSSSLLLRLGWAEGWTLRSLYHMASLRRCQFLGLHCALPSFFLHLSALYSVNPKDLWQTEMHSLLSVGC